MRKLCLSFLDNSRSRQTALADNKHDKAWAMSWKVPGLFTWRKEQ